MRNAIRTAVCGLALVTGIGLAQQSQSEYLDVLKVKVRPDRLMDYEAAIKKLVQLNRKSGDHWVAYGTEYGDSGALYFASPRQNLADIQTGMSNFENALKEGLGAAGFMKMMYDLNAMSTSAKAELRRRRLDLSVNAPRSREEQMRLVATSRWIRTIRVDVKPGRMGEFTEAWKPWQEELSKLEPRRPVLVSITATGTPAVTVGMYYKSLAEADEADKAIQPALTSETYRTFTKAVAEIANMTQWELHRFRPELSCPPDDLVAMDPEFWRPKAAEPAVATREKRKK